MFPTFLLILKSKTLKKGIKDPTQNLSSKMLYSQHLVITQYSWLENVGFILKPFMEVAEYCEFYNSPHARVKWSQLCSLIPQNMAWRHISIESQ